MRLSRRLAITPLAYVWDIYQYVDPLYTGDTDITSDTALITKDRSLDIGYVSGGWGYTYGNTAYAFNINNDYYRTTAINNTSWIGYWVFLDEYHTGDYSTNINTGYITIYEISSYADNKWVSRHMRQFYEPAHKGDALGKAVISSNINAYPADGPQDGFWYVRRI